MGLLQPIRRHRPVDGDIRHHALAYELVAHKPAHQAHLLILAQFTRQGDFHLAGQLGIDPLFRLFDHVPKGLPVLYPGRHFLVDRNHDLRMDDIGLVELKPTALRHVEQPFPGTVRGGGNCGTSSRTAWFGCPAKGA